MTPTQTRAKFSKIVEKEGVVLVAAKLKCSTTTITFIVHGKRDPGLRIAVAIEEAYKIPVESWVDLPASRSLTND